MTFCEPVAKSSTVETPDYIFRPLNEEFGFHRDVCATAENSKCEQHWNIEQDGLAQHWQGILWMNPPYGKVCGSRRNYESLGTHQVNWLMRYRGEVMVSGTNARIRRHLRCSIVSANQRRAETVESIVERLSLEALNEETSHTCSRSNPDNSDPAVRVLLFNRHKEPRHRV